MDELKEAQVKRQFFLRDAPMGSQPGAQQRPEALGGVDVNLMEAVSVFIAGVLAPAVAHGMVIKPPFRQPPVDIVFVGMNASARGDEPLDQRANRGLLDVVQHPRHHRPTPLDHPENRRLFFFQGTPAPRSLQPAPTTPAAFFSPRPDVPDAQPPHRPRRILLLPTGSVRVGERRSLGAVARSFVARRPGSTPTPGRSEYSISSTP